MKDTNIILKSFVYPFAYNHTPSKGVPTPHVVVKKLWEIFQNLSFFVVEASNELAKYVNIYDYLVNEQKNCKT